MSGSGSHAAPVARAAATDRARFIRLTYLHLALAILATVVLLWVLIRLPGVEDLARTMTFGNNWLVVLGAFFVASAVADRWARSDTSRAVQYTGLGVYVVAQALLILPLILSVADRSTRDALPAAAIITLLLFAGLTAVAVITRGDFSFLRGALAVGGSVALGLIVASILLGFSLGLLFSFAMVGLASGAILYNTSNILGRYRTEQYVAASLALFASVALMFRFVLRIVARR